MNNLFDNWSRTKIIATIGPATEGIPIMKNLITAGMDIARLNFSHNTIEYHNRIYNNLRKAARSLHREISIMQDLPGPKIRVGEMPESGVYMEEGKEFTFVRKRIKGNTQSASINHPGIFRSVKEDERILIDDGKIELRVLSAGLEKIICEVVTGGILTSHKGVNFPDSKLDVPSVTREDFRLLNAGMKMGVDLVALSFVRSVNDVIRVRKYLRKQGRDAFLISKIEKHEAVVDIDEIIEASDGIMVARGDLGVEVPLVEVPGIQKRIISKCNMAAVPVITATQVLESMINSPSPTRAEAADAANAVYDGTDALMLSGETSIGKYPLEAVRFLTAITYEVESDMASSFILPRRAGEVGGEIDENIGMSAVGIAKNVKAALIITPTRSGRTARLVSRFRPPIPVIALTNNQQVARELQLSYGVYPIIIQGEYHFNVFLKKMKQFVIKKGLAKKGSKIVICSGSPESNLGETNLLTVETL